MLSEQLADAVATAGATLVAVHARPRLPSTGVHWKDGVVVTTEATIRREDDIKVTLPDGRHIPATLAGGGRRPQPPGPRGAPAAPARATPGDPGPFPPGPPRAGFARPRSGRPPRPGDAAAVETRRWPAPAVGRARRAGVPG